MLCAIFHLYHVFLINQITLFHNISCSEEIASNNTFVSDFNIQRIMARMIPTHGRATSSLHVVATPRRTSIAYLVQHTLLCGVLFKVTLY